jgi:hypothetical protein
MPMFAYSRSALLDLNLVQPCAVSQRPRDAGPKALANLDLVLASVYRVPTGFGLTVDPLTARW